MKQIFGGGQFDDGLLFQTFNDHVGQTFELIVRQADGGIGKLSEGNSRLAVICGFRSGDLSFGSQGNMMDEIFQLTSRITVLKDGKFVGMYDFNLVSCAEVEALADGSGSGRVQR